MADNVNANLHKWNTGEVFRESSPEGIVPFYEEITVMKTEVKEEVYDYEQSVDDIEFVDVKTEYSCSVEDSSQGENVKGVKKSEQLLNENLVFGNCPLRETEQKTKYKCELCHSDFDEEIYLKSHYKECTFVEPKLSKKSLHLKRKNVLNRRTLVKQAEELKEYKCSDCKFTARNKYYLDRHIRTHTNERPFKCTYKNCKCPPEQKETCTCDTCGYASALKHHLKQHIGTHINDTPFKCTYKNCKCTPGQKESCKCDPCGYATEQNSNLKRHILVKHSKEPKKYKCADCKYATHDKCLFEAHTRSHTNDRPFKCTYKNCKCITGQEASCKCDKCEYAATGKSSLKIHILLKHSGKPKEYKCPNCKYAAHIKQTLERHIRRMHTNDKSI